MPPLSRRSTPFLLAAAFLAVQPALAVVNPPSQIRVQSDTSPWELGIKNELVNPGKVKIFALEPGYDAKGELMPNPAPIAEISSSKDTFKLPMVAKGTYKTYYIIFYPKLTQIDLTLTCYKYNTPSDLKATVNVKQTVTTGKLGVPKVTTKAIKDSEINEANYGKPGAPFIVLK